MDSQTGTCLVIKCTVWGNVLTVTVHAVKRGSHIKAEIKYTPLYNCYVKKCKMFMTLIE